ncbi:MAG TPA: NAD(P)H-hydrate dehydratase [bacterium]|nr:NAD(P)H-hydrate dehydratase [bacterium]
MQIIVTAAEMAALDRDCQQLLQMPSLLLMENAGRGIAAVAKTMLGEPEGKRVLIVSGPGNNGGDGYVVARHLANAGCRVTLWVLAARDKIRGDALTNLVIWEKMGGQTLFIDAIPDAPAPLPHLIVDALLGTGAAPPLSTPFAMMATLLNELGAPILAVDIPTGIDADTGAVPGPAIRARATAVMARLKRGLLFSPGREQAGEIHLIDISMPPEWAPKSGTPVRRLEAADIRARLPRRPADAHKFSIGSVGVIAGSIGYTGAACLTAAAALRAGCGLSCLAAAKSLLPLLTGKLPEVITWPFEDEESGCLREAALPQWLSPLAAQNALAVGPGLGRHPDTGGLVRRLLREMKQPMVLDADGLNLCTDYLDLLQNYQGALILTPHPGELSRLTGLTTAKILTRPVEVAAEWAVKLGQLLVLKGGPTVIAAPDGSVFVNSTGNPGMATAGAGDILTGLIAGLLAQGLAPIDAALCGVWLHGAAGDRARERRGEMGMIAGDLLEALPDALRGVLHP